MTRPPTALGLRIYRALAAAFPYEFKNAYGDEMVQVAEDAIEPIWREHGIFGVLRLLVDIAIRLPIEHFAELRHDVRYGLRMLAASPGFTAVALLSLGLAISVATSAFSELNAVLLRDVPAVSQPGRLVALQPAASYPAYDRIRRRTDLFANTLAYVAPVPFGVTIDGRTERAWGHLVTPSYFSTLGIRPQLGHLFDGREQAQSPAVVVSYRFWQNHLGSDPAIVGQTLRVNGHACTILGVGPKDFVGVSPLVFYADLWMPVSVDAQVVPELADRALERRDRKMFQVIGRLQPGVTVARAEAGLDTVIRQLEQSYGEEDRERRGLRATLLPGGKMFPIRSQDMPMVTALPMMLVGLILLIACSNIANMMLSRAAGRRKEIAIRLALGAGRARLIRQLLTESMLVAIGAGVLGLCLSFWLMNLASQVQMPLAIPVSYDLRPDGRALVFTLFLSLFTGLAFGLAPALRATRADLTPALKDTGAALLAGRRRLTFRRLLVLSQVTGSLMLLLLTGFLVLGFQRTSGIEVGFNPTNLSVLSLDPVRQGYSSTHAAHFFQTLLDRVQKLPSVAAACLTDTVPMSANGNPSVTFSTGEGTEKIVHAAHRYTVGKDYFDTLGIPILRGRAFRKEDEADDSTAIIVTEKLVSEFWRAGDPLGRRLEIADDRRPGGGLDTLGTFDHRSMAGARRTFEIVGVVKDVKMVFAMEDPRPGVFFPLRASDFSRPSMSGVTLIVRAAPGGDVIAAVRREISAMDANLAPFDARTMSEQIDRLMFFVRLAVRIYGTIGFFGLILASVGLAGVTAYSVTRRSHEIGIRMALGAGRGDVLRLVMREGIVLVGVGTVLGLAGAWNAARLLSGFVAAIATATSASISDPVLLVGAPLLLAGLALAACYLPARRSTRIDPVVALRQE
jgi:predicted permease